MIKTIKLTLALVLLGAVTAGAAENNIGIKAKSADKKFVAEVNADKDRNDVYQLTVYETGKGKRNVLWSCAYVPGGFTKGVLSDNGATFVDISEWYQEDKPVLVVYHKGERTNELTGKDFKIPPAKLAGKDGQKLWLMPKGPYYRFISVRQEPMALELITIDAVQHLIQLPHGQLLR